MSRPLILYYAPTACSIAPHIALEEIGVPFEPRRIDLAKGEQASPEFMALSPLGRVPTMIIDGEAVTEVPALLTYVASLRPEVGLTPAAGHARLCPLLRMARLPVEQPPRRLCPVSPAPALPRRRFARLGRAQRAGPAEHDPFLSRGRAPPFGRLGGGRRLFDRRHQPVSVLHLGVAARVRHSQGMPEMGGVVRPGKGAARGSARRRTRGHCRSSRQRPNIRQGGCHAGLPMGPAHQEPSGRLAIQTSH